MKKHLFFYRLHCITLSLYPDSFLLLQTIWGLNSVLLFLTYSYKRPLLKIYFAL